MSTSHSDRLTPQARSALMSRIRGSDTQPEMAVRRLLHGLGYRYLLHDRRLPGRPDLVFPARRKVILVHGCFWHGHDCGRGFRPTARAEYWARKLEANHRRDERVQQELEALGWQVAVVWECQTKPPVLPDLASRLTAFLGDAKSVPR